MATLSNHNGLKTIQFTLDGRRKTLRLGAVPPGPANTIREHIGHLIIARELGITAPKPTAEWVRIIGPELHGKLASFGLTPDRPDLTIGSIAAKYIERRTDVKPRTLLNLQQSQRQLIAFFAKDRNISNITKAECLDWRRSMAGTLAEATVATHIKKARQIFKDAVDRGYLERSPFVGVKAGNQANEERMHYVPAGQIVSIIEACPDIEWKMIFALARFAGIRTPSELRHLKWSDIDWEARRIKITSPKTEHHRGRRRVKLPAGDGRTL